MSVLLPYEIKEIILEKTGSIEKCISIGYTRPALKLLENGPLEEIFSSPNKMKIFNWVKCNNEKSIIFERICIVAIFRNELEVLVIFEDFISKSESKLLNAAVYSENTRIIFYIDSVMKNPVCSHLAAYHILEINKVNYSEEYACKIDILLWMVMGHEYASNKLEELDTIAVRDDYKNDFTNMISYFMKYPCDEYRHLISTASKI